MKIITYPIHECFYTFQGEGSHMGLPAFFVRTFGCPVKCTFCDSAGTWHPSWVPEHVMRLSPKAIVELVKAEGANRVVITGGEPCIFDLRPLTDALHQENIGVHLETSGAFEIKGEFDWVVLSPKHAQHPIASAVDEADEFKVIVEVPEDIRFFTELLSEIGLTLGDLRPIWLHPEWSQRSNFTVLGAIAEAVKRGKGAYRAGYQLHKLYQVDALDSRAKPLVPLGGNLSKGY